MSQEVYPLDDSDDFATSCLVLIDKARVRDKIYIYDCRCDERLKPKGEQPAGPKSKDIVVYYESIKREPKIRGIYECRCDERLQTKTKEFTRLPYTVLNVFLFSPTSGFSTLS
jgi:hypothetical protein